MCITEQQIRAEAGEALNELDRIIVSLLKEENKWIALADNLKVLLQGKWDIMTKGAIDYAINKLETQGGDFKESDVESILTHLEEGLGQPLSQACQQVIADSQLASYKMAFDNVDGMGTDVHFQFNKANQNALKWLQNNESYWIGEYYGANIKNGQGKKLNDFAKPLLEQGLPRSDAGKLLRRELEDEFTMPEGFKDHASQYWEGLADHIVTKAREFSRIDAYESAEIESVQVVAVIDSRTSAICRHLNGMIIPVMHLKSIRDKMLAAKSPEEAKTVSKWLTDKEANELVKGKTFQQLQQNDKTKSLAMPPYHFKCRTLTIAVLPKNFQMPKSALPPEQKPPAVKKKREKPLPDMPALPEGHEPTGRAVSQALQNKTRGETKKAIDTAIRIIDAVHGDGNLPDLPIRLTTTGNANGSFHLEKTDRNPDKITIRDSGNTRELTVLHEIGHFLDYRGFGEKNHFESIDNPDLAEWKTAIFNSEAVSFMQNYPIDPDNQGLIKYKAYCTTPWELWARSYAQYIATKSGNPVLLQQVASVKNYQWDFNHKLQWEQRDFEPIMQAFDELFSKLGWIKQ